MARFSTAEAIRQLMQMDTDTDEDSVADSDANDSGDGEYLPGAGAGTASDTSDHVSGESQESEDVTTSDEEPVNEPTATVNTRGRATARGRTRGRPRRSVGRGRGTHNASDSRQPTAADQPSDGTNTTVDRTGRQWATESPAVHRRQVQDIIRQQPGVTSQGRKASIKEVFQLYVSQDILSIVIRETNREAERCYQQWNSIHPDNQKRWKELDWEECEAFIGLLLLAGVYRGNQESLEELWSRKCGRPVFLATMSLKRFKMILRFCRFDNKNTREERRATDKLAAIRDVWTMFVSTLRIYYIPGTDLTVDEQLVPFRGRCPFRQYIPSKPAKYGIKVWWCCDSATSYPLNAEVYLGRQPNEVRDHDQGARVVKTLVSPWYKSGRNVVGDNLFTGIALAEELLTQGLTYVGTMRKNKRDIPPSMIAKSNDELSSTFAFDGNKTLVSYVPKKRKSVVLLSTMHHDKAVDGPKQKPEIILHYNSTKSGVDNMDHLACVYSCKRKINRWPMVLFFNILDTAAIASFVIWMCNNPDWNKSSKAIRRRQFIVSLGESLVVPLIRRRVDNPAQLRRPIMDAIQLLELDSGELETRSERPPPANRTQGRCHLCPREIDRKTRKFCDKCHRPACPAHSVNKSNVLCDKCS